jgi:lipoprotein-anchoring transpeptidase ErfK/SrfK
LTLCPYTTIFRTGSLPVEAGTRSSKGCLKRTTTFEIETLLSKLGYWIVKVDSRADASTRHAITAFQKVEGRKRTGVLSSRDLEALRSAESPKARFQTEAAHVEIDLTRQVLFLTDDAGNIVRILPVSSGNEKKYFDQGKWQVAHTPLGHFQIQRKVNGVRKASLGNLYYPNYFYGGVAIHGSNSVPSYPASHGCVRIPRFADRAFSRMVRVGTEVFVYD